MQLSQRRQLVDSLSGTVSNGIEMCHIQWNNSRAFKVLAVVFGGICFVSFTNTLYYRIYRLLKQSPPGPIGVPIFGSLIAMGPNPQPFYSSLATNYGPVTSFNLGLQKCVMISDLKLVKQLYPDNAMGGAKFVKPWGSDHEYISYPIMEVSNEMLSRRKISKSMLLSLANSTYTETVGRTILEQNVYPVFDQEPKRFECRNLLYNTAFNLTFGAVFGTDMMMKSDEDDFKQFRYLTDQAFSRAAPIFFISIMFGTENMFSKWLRCKLLNVSADYTDILKAYYDITLKYHERTKDVHNMGNDALTYVDRMNQYISEKKMSMSFEYNEFKIINDIAMLLIAATESTTHTLEFILILLARHPEIQQQIYDELKKNFGDNDKFSLKTLNKCTLLRAFIWECLRLYPAVVAFRECPRRMKVGDYFIDKGHLVLWSQFDINRQLGTDINLNLWIDEKTSKFKMNHNVSAFGIGQRSCAGRPMAIKNLTFVTGMLIMRYHIIDTEGGKYKNIAIIDSAGVKGLVMSIGDKEIPLQIKKR